jgi:hypothetical protein
LPAAGDETTSFLHAPVLVKAAASFETPIGGGERAHFRASARLLDGRQDFAYATTTATTTTTPTILIGTLRLLSFLR